MTGWSNLSLLFERLPLPFNLLPLPFKSLVVNSVGFLGIGGDVMVTFWSNLAPFNWFMAIKARVIS
jgi:hypothetical protein